MEYIFNESKFIKSFSVKEESRTLTHRHGEEFKLFPFKATSKKNDPIITNLEDVVSAFFREVHGTKTAEIDFDSLFKVILDDVEVDDNDIDTFKDIIKNFFFVGNDFVAKSLGLYPYQLVTSNKSVDGLAHFLFSVFGLNSEDCDFIEQVKDKYKINVLERLVIGAMEHNTVLSEDNKAPYFRIKINIQEKFRDDFRFMLEYGMTSLDDFSNLFSLYYFYYVSQTCITLDRFCAGDRDKMVEFYYALDWEKVSKNRLCCTSGWEQIQASINHMFSHAITLEILNQTNSEDAWDYIEFQKYVNNHKDEDKIVSNEIKKAEKIYCSYISDYNKFADIPINECKTQTEEAIIHLFKCVKAQFEETERKRASQSYSEKFSDFCKHRWIKNRKKSGLVLNLTERDIIFLTKISLKNKEKIRLNDLYKEYERRGIYLDNNSKEHLQEFFTKLNLIDKKSDSGDAQYVKRIL
ncbi:DNA phosphorothioation-dependent restriction protein DptG [Anaerovibrio sp.]|uniref:DNA phosphorothioation-dependent restriction protein DptG n=1 Tax=Anaerovibrio sp. TaxID=1872532 RepID=UPI00388F12A9